MAFTTDGFHAPAGMRTNEFLLRPIVSADAELDYAAVMESSDFLRIWEGSSWPEDDFTVEANRKDMHKLEQRHNDRESFAYTVMNLDETECLGCVYIFPPDAGWLASSVVTPTEGAVWSDYDALVYFWVRKSRLADELDKRLLIELGEWLQNDWPVERHVVVTSEPFEQQVAMIESTGLQRKFRLQDPEEEGASIAYA